MTDKKLNWKNSLTKQKGFTLVESVIAIVIVGVIGVIMADILSRAFDNTQKTNLISNIQQNGQAALSNFENNIRYAEFVCVGGLDQYNVPITSNQVLVDYYSPIMAVFRDGKFIRYRIIPQIDGLNGANGYIVEDYPTQPESGVASELCNSQTYIAVSSRKITNDTMLSVRRGTIMLLTSPVNTQLSTQSIGTPKVSVTITFALGAPHNAPTNPESQIGTNNEIEFKSTAQFR